MDVDQEYKSAARRSVVLLTVLGALSQLLVLGTVWPCPAWWARRSWASISW